MKRLRWLLVVLVVTACAPAGWSAGPDTGSVSPSPPQGGASASAPSPSLAPSPSRTPSPSRAPRTATINVSGDLLWHNTLWKSAELDAKVTGAARFDFTLQLEPLRSYVSSADLAICHSEVPFAEPGGPYGSYPLFAAPQEIAPALAATGWDLCTTASNHSMDAGWAGLVRTIEVHRAAGILTAGTYATEAEAAAPVIFTTEGGVRIAVISQTFSLNGLSKARGREWSVEFLDAESAVEQARRARQAGADLVTVHMHAGDEYSTSVNSQQREFAETVTASGLVDLVFGQHAHVVQPIDRMNGTWVVYGAGNLLAQSGPGQPRTYDGFMAQITFTEQPGGRFEATAAEFAPTFITKASGRAPARVYLVSDALAAGIPGADELRRSAARTREVVRAHDVEGLTERS